MQTNFSLAQLADPDTQEADAILRKCVHCGFCTATCPTYVLGGNELDSPRGRIYLIKDTLENDKPASDKMVKHIDRCLSCLSCMTTCPSGVNYMHLVDQARTHIEKTYKRPLPDRLLRGTLATILPRPGLFRLSLVGAWLMRPIAGAFPGRLTGLIRMAPRHLPRSAHVDRPQVFHAEGKRRGRVALMNGCAQQVIGPTINEATIRLLTRAGVEVVVTRGSGCCGALVHHLGKEEKSRKQAAANIRAWKAEADTNGLDAVIVNASGCGTTVKDYGYMFRTDDALAQDAARISAMTKDVTEYLADIGLPKANADIASLRVTYHSACSMQHGQKITTTPKTLLEQAGFSVATPADAHLCCGSAGTYNLLQPEIAGQLKDRKVDTIARTEPDVVASGNVGCIAQIADGLDAPVVHTVELLDWATGGPKPKSMRSMRNPSRGEPAS